MCNTGGLTYRVGVAFWPTVVPQGYGSRLCEMTDGVVVRFRQHVYQVGSSPSGAQVRGAVFKSVGNSSLARIDVGSGG